MKQESGIFKEERQTQIVRIVEENGRINTAEIQRKFGVSYGTARNDLDELAAAGKLLRTHSGAIRQSAPSVGWTPDIHKLSSKERCGEEIYDNYLALAKAAAAQIAEGDMVFLTSASLGWLIAREIPGDLRCTVATNSASVAEELRKKEAVRVFLAGGEMAENGNFYDEFARRTLASLRFDKAFLTAAGISASFGMSVQGGTSVGITRTVIEGTRKVIGVFPAAKVGTESIQQICPADSILELITEAGASEGECEALAELGIKVTKICTAENA